MPNDWTNRLDSIVEQQLGEMIAVRRYIHSNPEPSGEERHTTKYLADALASPALRIRIGPNSCGLIVDPAVAASTRRIAIRGDLDALRIQEQNAQMFCSQVPGLMHGCGHDVHSAILFGTIRALIQASEEQVLPWPVGWRAVFQPAEETNRGALEMIAAGAMDDISAIIALHVDPSRAVGKVGVRIGPFTAACDEMQIVVEGRGGHAARPHESIDSIAIAAQLVSSVYLFVPRGVDSQDPVVVTFGEIHGGDNSNVIPSKVLLRGTVRTLGGIVRQKTKDHIRQLARGLAEASGARITVDFVAGPESVMNDRDLTALFRQASTDLLGAANVEEILRASMGGEDFAHYLQHVPGAMFRLGCCGNSTNCAPLHSPLFDPDERCLAIGAKILARTAVLWSEPHTNN